ncbi:MAG: SMP-30/gluconolactonase/LRE family protein [Bauldia sp.]|nr:SMP-30/gluconolactonase/LRE family protein [Bauldia sp.]
MKRTLTARAVLGGLAALAVVGMAGAANAQDVLLGEGVFPESIAATPDGGLISGSVAGTNIYIAAPGATEASVFATVAEGSTLGVFADGDTVYACNVAPGFGPGTLLTFDTGGNQTGAYPLPNGGLCNDIAVGPDGTVYVTDTGGFAGRPGAVLALVEGQDGALTFATVFASSSIGGADGLAFVGDDLYVNDVMTGALWGLSVSGSTLNSVWQVTLDRALAGPDGMRAASNGGLLVAENAAGRVSHIAIDGSNGTVTTVAEGDWESATGVAEANGQIYVIDTKFGAMGNPDATPGPFSIIAIGGM